MSVDIAIQHRFANFALDVAFRVDRPGITSLFGPSGAGKTSVINAIAGVLRPQQGRIIVNGRVLFDDSAGICVAPRERCIGYVFQDARLFPHMSVSNNLRFGWRRAPRPAPESEIARVIDLLGLKGLLHRGPRSLSGGEKARVALGRALLSSPEILLLDEPLAALDATRKGEILPYLERLRDEVRLPMIYVSHSLDEVSRVADQMIVLRTGRVMTSGSIFDVLTDLSLPDFTGAAPYGALLDATVAEHLAEGLSVLSFAGGTLVVPLLACLVGTRLRVRVRAEDVLLAREKPEQISANNILPVKIADICATSALYADVRLLCGTTALVARITHASCTRLGLLRGEILYAIIKSVTVVPGIAGLGGHSSAEDHPTR